MGKKPIDRFAEASPGTGWRVFWWVVYLLVFVAVPIALHAHIRHTGSIAESLKFILPWIIFCLVLIGRMIVLFATRNMPRMARKEATEGYLCILPWLIGFCSFTLGPMIFSIYIAMCDWDIINAPRFVGLANFQQALFHDFRFIQALKVTIVYAMFALPLGLIGSLMVALLLNQKVRGMSWFRTIFYIPAILPGVATAMVWKWIFNPENGILNIFLSSKIWPWLHIGNGLSIEQIALVNTPPPWLADPKWALPAFILMSLWGIGGGMIIYLAGLQGIPTQLYEAAEIDGANPVQKFWKITLPMVSPTIFFNLVMGVIGSFQVFTSSFVMTAGGPAYATLFYLLYLYQKAFQYFQMGYAAAMAWILFVVILICTLLVFKSSSAWVYYEGELKGKR
jgi:multiple sugar transport system permease protein